MGQTSLHDNLIERLAKLRKLYRKRYPKLKITNTYIIDKALNALRREGY